MSSMAVSVTSRRDGVEKCRPKLPRPHRGAAVFASKCRLGHSCERHVILPRSPRRHVVRHGDRDDMSADMSSTTVCETTYRPIRCPQRRPRRHVTNKNDKTMMAEARRHRDVMSKNDDMSSRQEMSSFVDACLARLHC